MDLIRTINVVVAPVRDVAAFARTAFWLSRSGVPGDSLRVDVGCGVEPDRVAKILRCYRANYHWTCRSGPARPDPCGKCVRVHLQPDAVALPGTIARVAREAESLPGHRVVVPGLRLGGEALLTLDPYGSNLYPERVRAEPHAYASWEDAALAAWDLRDWSGDGPEFLLADAPVYLQESRPLPANVPPPYPGGDPVVYRSGDPE